MAMRDGKQEAEAVADAEDPTDGTSEDEIVMQLRGMLEATRGQVTTHLGGYRICIWATALFLVAAAIVVYWIIFFVDGAKAAWRDVTFLLIMICLGVVICLSFQMKNRRLFRILVAAALGVNCLVGAIALFVRAVVKPLRIHSCKRGCNSLWAASVFAGLLPGFSCLLLIAGIYYCTITYQLEMVSKEPPASED